MVLYPLTIFTMDSSTSCSRASGIFNSAYGQLVCNYWRYPVAVIPGRHITRGAAHTPPLSDTTQLPSFHYMSVRRPFLLYLFNCDHPPRTRCFCSCCRFSLRSVQCAVPTHRAKCRENTPTVFMTPTYSTSASLTLMTCAMHIYL